MRLLRWTGRGIGNGEIIVPGASGTNEPPIMHMYTSAASGRALGSSVSKAFQTSLPEIEDSWIRFEDYASGFQGSSLGGKDWNRVEFRFQDPLNVENTISGPIGVYSMRIATYQNSALSSGNPLRYWAFVNGDAGPLTAHNTSVYKWGLHSTGLVSGPGSDYKPYINDGWSVSPLGGIPANNLRMVGVRLWEVQVDVNRNPNTVVRCYNTTLTNLSWASKAVNVTDPVMDRLYLGDNDTAGNNYHQEQRYAWIEVHDDYDLGGQFTATDPANNPASPAAASTATARTPVDRYTDEQKYNWKLLSRGTGPGGTDQLLDLTPKGVHTGASTEASDIYYSEFWSRRKKVAAYTSYSWLLDEGGDPDTSLAWSLYSPAGNSPTFRCHLFYPGGTPPSQGWPLILWAHSGFFIAGTPRALDRGWLEHLLHQGFAVCSIGYVLGDDPELLIDSNTPYPSYPSAGQYPTFITDYKNCANFMRRVGREAGVGNNTYPLDTTRMIFTGYSAGGFCALGAATSRDITDDGSGRNLTVRSSPINSRVPMPGDNIGGDANQPNDPTPIGCYVFGGPVDMRYAIDNDDTHPDFGIEDSGTGIPPMGLIRAAAYSFRGLRCDQDPIFDADLAYFDDISIANYINIQRLAGRSATHVPIIGYERGTSDYLVKEGHIERLEDAMALAGRPLTRVENHGVIHDNLDTQFDWTSFRGWLDTLPGL